MHDKKSTVNGEEQLPPREYQFFSPRKIDTVFEGREHHEYIKYDVLGRQFPTAVQICWVLFAFSLAIYLFSMSWTVFPGAPIQALIKHLRMEPIPSNLNLLWGWGVRVADLLPGASLALWIGLASAVCGALSVALFARIMMRVGYLVRNEPGSASSLREAYARRLSGLTSGLFLAFCIPFWVASTRTLPATFHVLLLLLAAWFFSEYQHWGR
ncbi:MAG: DUF2723 domain-containing protein, partial [Verrucomicrobiota bacterium]|nr:DUF2723 domain-containing protein [Verrucomicrobiota bacterium]